MTFIRKFNGKTERDIERAEQVLAVYCCPEHGEFDAEVFRNDNGEAPDLIACRVDTRCHQDATWTPSPVRCKVPRVTAVRGKWERPERETYLDTRELGEGMDIEEFQAKRAAVWERKRQEDVMAVKKGFG